MVFVMCFSSSRFELKSTSATSRMSASVSRPVVSMSSPIAYSLVMFLLLSVCSLAFFQGLFSLSPVWCIFVFT